MSSFLYKGGCDCGKNYFGETGRNANVQLEKCNRIRIKSEPAK